MSPMAKSNADRQAAPRRVPAEGQSAKGLPADGKRAISQDTEAARAEWKHSH